MTAKRLISSIVTISIVSAQLIGTSFAYSDMNSEDLAAIENELSKDEGVMKQ